LFSLARVSIPILVHNILGTSDQNQGAKTKGPSSFYVHAIDAIKSARDAQICLFSCFMHSVGLCHLEEEENPLLETQEYGRTALVAILA
jgi:hypothetical protein